jgi:uncharacterized membrane protein
MESTVLAPGSTLSKTAYATRIQSIDLLRGAVMVLMAVDHVRVYAGVPAGGPSAGVFFTRWITHFCAPAFVFLAGTSAFFYGRKINDKSALARYLVMRGLLLVLLELTVIRLSWTFNFNYQQFVLAGVIWMLGWCMVIMAALVQFRPLVTGIIGLVIIAGQQLFALVPNGLPVSMRTGFGRIWEFFYPSGLEGVSGITILYVLIPWIGVMAVGYGFGSILLNPQQQRKRICLWIGCSAMAVFVIAGSLLIVSSPAVADAPPFIFRLLNQNKYPPSQLYLLMTLGPLIALVPVAERAHGWLVNVLKIIGRVPMFYYLLHIWIIHISAILVRLWQDGVIHHEWYATAPYASVPPENRWSLPLLYLVFLIDVVILYVACRWYERYKFSHREKKWLKYL